MKRFLMVVLIAAVAVTIVATTQLLSAGKGAGDTNAAGRIDLGVRGNKMSALGEKGRGAVMEKVAQNNAMYRNAADAEPMAGLAKSLDLNKKQAIMLVGILWGDARYLFKLVPAGEMDKVGSGAKSTTPRRSITEILDSIDEILVDDENVDEKNVQFLKDFSDYISKVEDTEENVDAIAAHFAATDNDLSDLIINEFGVSHAPFFYTGMWAEMTSKDLIIYALLKPEDRDKFFPEDTIRKRLALAAKLKENMSEVDITKRVSSAFDECVEVSKADTLDDEQVDKASKALMDILRGMVMSTVKG
jgi:hypothetical protein